MESLHKRIKRNNLILFFGGMVLVLFFIVAVKFNLFLSSMMTGEQLPKIEASQSINRIGSNNHYEGKVVLLFFLRPSIKISKELLKWAIEWDKRYRHRGLTIIAIASPREPGDMDMNGLREFAGKNSVTFEMALDKNGEIRKKMRHFSFATIYITNRFGTVEFVGDATDGEEETRKNILSLL